MAKGLWFTKRGVEGRFYRCGVCKADMPNEGVFVRVGNQVLAIVCADCHEPTIRNVCQLAPHSFPDLDDFGELL